MEINGLSQMVKDSIQLQIVQAFRNTPEAIDELVKVALSKEVNQQGSSNINYNDKRMPYLEWRVGDDIRRVADQAIREVIEERKEEIKASVRERLKNEETVDSIIETMIGALKDDWRVDIKFREATRKERGE